MLSFFLKVFLEYSSLKGRLTFPLRDEECCEDTVFDRQFLFTEHQ